MNEWLTIEEALAILHSTSRNTLKKYLEKFKIRISKPLGGRVFINYKDLMEAINKEAFTIG